MSHGERVDWPPRRVRRALAALAAQAAAACSLSGDAAWGDEQKILVPMTVATLAPSSQLLNVGEWATIGCAVEAGGVRGEAPTTLEVASEGGCSTAPAHAAEDGAPGHYRLRATRPGIWRVQCHSAGAAAAGDAVRVQWRPAAPEQVGVQAAATGAVGSFLPARCRGIDAFDNPVPQAALAAAHIDLVDDGRVVATVAADAGGLWPPRPGRYRLRCRQPGAQAPASGEALVEVAQGPALGWAVPTPLADHPLPTLEAQQAALAVIDAAGNTVEAGAWQGGWLWRTPGTQTPSGTGPPPATTPVSSLAALLDGRPGAYCLVPAQAATQADSMPQRLLVVGGEQGPTIQLGPAASSQPLWHEVRGPAGSQVRGRLASVAGVAQLTVADAAGGWTTAARLDDMGSLSEVGFAVPLAERPTSGVLVWSFTAQDQRGRESRGSHALLVAEAFGAADGAERRQTAMVGDQRAPNLALPQGWHGGRRGAVGASLGARVAFVLDHLVPSQAQSLVPLPAGAPHGPPLSSEWRDLEVAAAAGTQPLVAIHDNVVNELLWVLWRQDAFGLPAAHQDAAVLGGRASARLPPVLGSGGGPAPGAAPALSVGTQLALCLGPGRCRDLAVRMALPLAVLGAGDARWDELAPAAVEDSRWCLRLPVDDGPADEDPAASDDAAAGDAQWEEARRLVVARLVDQVGRALAGVPLPSALDGAPRERPAGVNWLGFRCQQDGSASH